MDFYGRFVIELSWTSVLTHTFSLCLFFPSHFHQTAPPQSELPATRLGYFLWNLLCRICFRHQLLQNAATASQLNGASPHSNKPAHNAPSFYPLQNTFMERGGLGTAGRLWIIQQCTQKRQKSTYSPPAKNTPQLHGSASGTNEYIPYVDLENIHRTPKVVSGMCRGWVFKWPLQVKVKTVLWHKPCVIQWQKNPL